MRTSLFKIPKSSIGNTERMEKRMPELRKLKGRMREKGVTGIQLAAMIGKEKNYVYAICNGKVSPRMDQVYIICHALDIPPEAITLYFPEGEMSAP